MKDNPIPPEGAFENGSDQPNPEESLSPYEKLARILAQGTDGGPDYSDERI